MTISFAFAAVGMAGTTYMRSWQDFDKVSLALIPLFLFSATFYPLSVYPGWLQAVIRCTPLYQGRGPAAGPRHSASCRGRCSGHAAYLARRRLLGLSWPPAAWPPAPALTRFLTRRPARAVAPAPPDGPSGIIRVIVRIYGDIDAPGDPPRPPRRPRRRGRGARASVISLDDAGRLAGLLGLIADPVRLAASLRPGRRWTGCAWATSPSPSGSPTTPCPTGCACSAPRGW